MSDDENGMPEEIQAMIEAAMRAQMKVFGEGAERHAERHKLEDEMSKAVIHNFIDGLNVDQLKTLHDIVTMTIESGEVGYNLSGVIIGCLMFKHGRSWNGGDTPWSAGPSVMDDENGEHKITHDEAREALSNLQAPSTQERDMEKYNIEPDPNNEGYFRCKGCHMFVFSLEDRMLREPGTGGCDGCKHKQAWG
ncbi:gp050 [Rhodococcus phage ReqiDocB7]|uniref:gp050 n=1 Tax=Rhodococcus phage ReqiDocB7 TaxID=691966 RepID=UPI0001CDD84B|nr:gp050 [Rhodococcus phage ReqiDocB7]ADD80836.1 gp050 [Rhodococcus phage ReqiDocB7]